MSTHSPCSTGGMLVSDNPVSFYRIGAGEALGWPPNTAYTASTLRYNLDGFFPAESAVWSACRLSKTDIFVRVIQAHLAAHGHSEAARCYGVGSSTELLPRGFLAVVVGDGTEEEAAAQRLQLPFVKVCSASDLSKVGRYLAGRQPAPTAEQAA